MSFKDKLKEIFISGESVLPLVEGGKGIAASNGESAGAWASTGGVGTFSAVNPHIPGDERLSHISSFNGKTRLDRHKEMIERAIVGGIAQAKIAYETACNRGRIHMNVLWEMGGTEEILHGILSKVKGLIHGVTCGAGMPFRLAEICAKYDIKYYPIVSSARAFGILWKRAYCKLANWLGGMVYEDPWLAGGHNGLSTQEDELVPQPPEPRVRDLRNMMRSFGISDLVPIFVAGGVWCLSEWVDWIENPDLGTIAFQFGTRPLLTKESPIPDVWKAKLLKLTRGDVLLNRFSPTGFPSSAIKNEFLMELQYTNERQVVFSEEATEEYSEPFFVGVVDCRRHGTGGIEGGTKRNVVFVSKANLSEIDAWIAEGFVVCMKTPSKTLIFVNQEQRDRIMKDRGECIGCLSACNFSGWNQNPESKVTISPDPRSFCIQKALQSIFFERDPEQALLFCGQDGWRFGEDPFYKNGIPTVKELVERLQTGQ
jgi:NAD(P)H-dependent flavin oxidoreductase YrpB (nitropropane dioxygenase family)